MAAVAAAQRGVSVILLDKGDRLGRKLMISGGGRCNVTNRKPLPELIRNIPGNGRFMYSALTSFNNEDIIAFFEGLGIRLKEEDRGRMFPISDKAKTVAEALINYIKRLGVTIHLNEKVDQLLFTDDLVTGARLEQGGQIAAKSVVVATGGASVPQTGSTGDGYPWAVSAGHRIIDLYPTEVPLTSREAFIVNKSLMGLSLRQVQLTLWDGQKKKVVTEEGDMIFTHFGISGPVALRLSHYVVSTQQKEGPYPLLVTIKLLPQIPNVQEEVFKWFAQEPRRQAKNVLAHYLPERLVPLLLERAGLKLEVTAHHLSQHGVLSLAKNIQSFPVWVSGTLPLKDATVTGGGVHLKEINPKTMASKKKEGLYFAGEILDVHAHTGGYNITVAFSTGHLAGASAADFVARMTPSL